MRKKTNPKPKTRPKAKAPAPLLLALFLADCGHSPTEPADPPKRTPGPGNTNCPQAEKDMYGFCIPASPPPPCSLLGPDGKPYPNCTP